jgi:hypothetical protein
MSAMPPLGASHATAEHPRPSSSASKISEDDRIELEKLGRAVARMKKHTLDDPYIQTIAQDKHCRYQYQWRSQQYQWLHNAPFKYDEGENIQYQTFVFREPGSDMISLHAQHHDEERPGTADSTRNATGSNTPAQGPKKVISFGAYKKKQSGETPARDGAAARDGDKFGKQPAVKGPAERVKALEAESADMIKTVEENEKAEAARNALDKRDAPREKEAPPKQPELKRKREESVAAVKDKTVEVNGKQSPPPPKKCRTEASPSAPKEANKLRSPSPTPAKRTTSKQNVEADTHMPPKLSPLRDEFFELPPLLSPELPANIDAALKATDTKRAADRDRDNKKDERRAKGTKAPANAGKKGPEARRPESLPPTNEKAAEAPQNARPARVSSDGQSAGADSKRKTLIVKIRFKKARREDVQRILKLPARPGRRIASPSSSPAASDDEDVADPASSTKETPSKTTDKTDESRRYGKGVAQKIGPMSKKAEDKRPTAEKRPRAEPAAGDLDNPGPPAKKKKVDDVAHEQPVKKRQADAASSQEPLPKIKAPTALDLKKAPSTPVAPPVPSPAVSSVQRSHIVTPVTRKDLLHPRRETSMDSQVETPSAKSSTPVEPKRTSHPNGTSSKPLSGNPNPAKTSTSQAWDAEHKRLDKLGRDLKHGASDLVKDNPNSKARRMGAAKALESLICYILAFTCSDRAALVADKSVPLRAWRSLTPFCSFVGRLTHNFPELDGLASGLAVVIHAHILDIASQFPNDAPSRDSLIELSGALRKAAVHAEENLDVDVLMRTFPKSWAARSKTTLAALAPGAFGEPKTLLQGGYRLPLGVQTDALQAARASVALLKEWLAKEGLEYDFKVTTV